MKKSYRIGQTLKKSTVALIKNECQIEQELLLIPKSKIGKFIYDVIISLEFAFRHGNK